MSDIEPGDVVAMKSFKAVIQNGEGWIQWKASNGKAFYFMLLGVDDIKTPKIDPKAILNDLGWYAEVQAEAPEPELESEPEIPTKQDDVDAYQEAALRHNPFNRPNSCRNQLKADGFPYPKSGCSVCKNGGLMGCPYERQGQKVGRAID